MLFTVDKAHLGPGTSGAGALQTLSLPQLAFSLCLVWFNKAVVGTRKLLSWDVARAQVELAPKNHSSSGPAAAPWAGNRLWGLHPPGAEPFARLGGAKVPLTPPRDQISARVLQQKELHCPGPCIVPSPAKSSSHSPGYRAALPVLACGISSGGRRLMGRGDDGLQGLMRSMMLRCSGVILEAWQGTDSADEAGTAWHGPICR